MKTKITILNFIARTALLLVFSTSFGQIVTSNADDGSAGTLRNQIATAPAGGTITFGIGITNIVLTSGAITIDKSLVITGNLIATTTIDANANGRIFDITSGTVILNDLILTNGLADNGGAIQVVGANLTINNSSVTNSVANGISGSGGAILVGTDASLTATLSTFSGNRANRAGGAIEVVAGTTTMLTNVNLLNNNAGVAPATAAPGNGGALHVTGNATVTITNGSVNMNTAASEGGGLWNGTGTMTVNGTTIDGNTAAGVAADNGGGGIYNLNNGTLIIMNAAITNNSATGVAGSGGGILNDVGATVTVTNSAITGNTANRAGGGIEGNATMGTSFINLTGVTLNGNTVFTSPGNGGGLHMTGPGTIMISGGTVNNNTAGAEGGGLWNGSGMMTISGTTIDGNTASGAALDNGGGGIYNLNGGTLLVQNGTIISNNIADGTLGSGGGILNDAGSTLTVNNSTISGNRANRAGGGIETQAGSTVNLMMATLTGNNAGVAPAVATPGSGGGLHASGNATINITDGMVNMNTAASEGGGLWNGTGIMTINGTTIDANTASGVDATNGGGGIYNLNAGTVAISNATISNNIANGTAGSGGGILNDVGSQLSISGTSITGNTAVRAGGGIEDNSGTSTILLTNVNLDNNSVTGPPGNGGGLHITGAGNVTISGGTVNGNTASLEGGGLWNGTGIMSVTDTEIDGNTAAGNGADDGGAGIFNNGGTLTLDTVMVTDNNATGTSGSGGGLLSTTGAITIMNSTFDGNAANRAGGAIEVINGTLTITNSDLTNNDVDGSAGTANPGNGGAIHISGITTTMISGGTVSNNDAGREGGGLWNQTGSTMTVMNVTLDGNSAGGAAITQGGGALFNNGGTLNVNNSTLSNNMVDGALGNGGAIHVKTGTVNVMLSTISGNTSLNDGGAIYNNAMLDLNAVTIANNTATANGGGIANNASSTPTLKNTIVATNTSAVGMDVFTSSTGFVSNGYNLIGVDATNAFPATATDIEGMNPLLGTLANNGGTTFTHALLSNSPAYNFGAPTDMFNDQLNNTVFDGRRDIGAFEAQAVLSNAVFAGKVAAIYPNPATNGLLNITLESNFSGQVSGKIYELGSGKVVKQFNTTTISTEVRLDNLASGVYVIQLVSESFSETHKLIIGR